jgi:hypothetical protein
METLQRTMDFGCNPDVIRVMSVGNKGIVMDTHTDTSWIVFPVYHRSETGASNSPGLTGVLQYGFVKTKGTVFTVPFSLPEVLF